MGKSQGKPLATIHLVWVSDEGSDKTPRSFAEIVQGRLPGIAQNPTQKVCMTPATVRLGTCSRMRLGPQVTSRGQGFPSILQELPMKLSEKAFKDWPSLPQEFCNVSQRTPRQLIKGRHCIPKIFQRIPGKFPEGFSVRAPGIPQRLSGEFPEKAREIPGDSLANPRENPKAIPIKLWEIFGELPG